MWYNEGTPEREGGLGGQQHVSIQCDTRPAGGPQSQACASSSVRTVNPNSEACWRITSQKLWGGTPG